MTDTCATCRYFDPHMNEASGKDVGVCKRYPKAAVYTGSDRQLNATFVHYWPEMMAGDWCGEFSRGD